MPVANAPGAPMPIFMDRHHLKGATPAELAEAHRKDLSIQDQYGVQFLTYWYDQHRGTTFCLVDAPDKETAQQVHRDSHGMVAEEIMEVSLSAVEAFLGRITDPKPAAQGSAPELDAGHRAILFTDIVGSTEMTARLGDRMAAELVRAHDSLVRRSLEKFGGRQVKHTGDGIMASFDTASAAVDCARDIQRAFADYNRANTEPIHVRIGMDSGDPVEDSNDLFGATVQLASRLCAAAAADQILASKAIVDECGRRDGFLERGAKSLKGFSSPVSAFECVWSAG
jgi:class 3 adenylate cyclase